MEASASISTPLGFVPREAIAEFRALGVPFRMDIRRRADGRPVTPPPELPYEAVSCVIEDARRASEPFTLDTAGFTMIDHVSAVQDWRDNDEVIRVFYEECRQVARELTGARHVYTYDHVRREAGVLTRLNGDAAAELTPAATTPR